MHKMASDRKLNKFISIGNFSEKGERPLDDYQ